MANERPLILVSADEREKVSRAVLVWLNAYPDKPVERINFEMLEDDMPSMALSTIQGAYKVKQYILGGYLAQYQFKIVYRVQPNTSNDKRLKADEALDQMADWLADNIVALTLTAARPGKLEINTAASIFGAYENGDEDHQILLTLTYEVF